MTPDKDTAYRGIPGTRTVQNEAPTGHGLKALLAKITHRAPDGQVVVNEDAPEIRDIMDDADARDVDVVLTPTGTNTSVVMGEGIADHHRFVPIGVAAGLGALALLGVGGVILRKRRPKDS